MPLTIRQQKFVDGYIESGNADQAFGEAYGYSQKTHGYSSAAGLMQKPEIFLAVIERRVEISAASKMSREDLAEQLANIARANVTDYYEWDEHGTVKLKASDDLTRDQAAAISEVIINREASGRTTIRVKLHDKVTAIKQLANLSGYSGDVNIQLNQFVLRAPPVAESTEAWIESTREHQARQLEAEAKDSTPSAPAHIEAQAASAPPPYASPAYDVAERARLPDPPGMSLDGRPRPRGGPKRIS